MAKRGNIQFPVDGTHNPYVNDEGLPRAFDYKGNRYKINYFDGCFYPFVVKG